MTLPIVEIVSSKLTKAVDDGYGADDFLSLFCLAQQSAGLEVDLPRP